MSAVEKMTDHWSQHIQEIVASIHVEGVINTLFSGGAENGQFCWINDTHKEHINFHSGKFVKGDIVLDIQGEKVGGYVIEDLVAWTKQVTKSNGPVMFKVVRGEGLKKDLRQYLNTRFQQNSVDHELQQVIRTNLYRRTIPCTTRSARPGEVNGVDYTFLSVDEFLALEKGGTLLESGRYEGNYYGTPRPSKQGTNGNMKTNGQNLHSFLPMDADGGVAWQQSPQEENQINAAMNSSISFAASGDDEDLPYGWEMVEDPRYGVYYIDHINKKTQYERPTEQISDARLLASKTDDSTIVDGVSPEQNVATDQMILPVFTKNPEEMEGEFVRTKLVKGPHGLGFTIIGGDQPDMTFLQIKDVVPLGPAYHDGSLETGDVLVNVNGVNVLGFAHQDILQLFQSMPVGQSVSLEVCRGYPLPFDPNDPDTEIVTTVAVKQREDSSPGVHVVANSPPIPYTMLPQQSTASAITPNKNAARSMPDLTESAMSSMQSPTTNGSRDAGPPQFLCISIMKGPQGFGFTIADSLYGQRVRQIIDRPRCKNLMEGDLLLEINRIGVKDMPHAQVVQLLKNCLHDIEASVLVQRGGIPPASRQITSPVSNYNGSAAVEVQNNLNKSHNGVAAAGAVRGNRASSSDELDDVFVAGSFETSAASRLAAHIVAISPSRPVQSPPSGSNDGITSPTSRASSSNVMAPRPLARDPVNWSPENHKRVVTSQNEPNLQKVRPQENVARLNRSRTPGPDFLRTASADEQWSDESELRTQRSKTPTPQQQQGIVGATPNFVPASEYRTIQRSQHAVADAMMGREGMAPGRLLPLTPGHQLTNNGPSDKDENRNVYKSLPDASRPPSFIEKTVVLNRLERGFGFKIIGGTEEGSQVAVGPIVPGGAADIDGRLRSGDELLYVDGVCTVGASHQSVVQLMNRAGAVGHVVLVIRRHGNMPTDILPSPVGSQMSLTQRGSLGRRTYDVTLARRADEGFGFVIISSVTQTDTVIDNTNLNQHLESPYPWIGRIIEGTPAHRCGRLAVGDHILAVNGAPLHHMHHDAIVNLIKQSGYNIVLTISRDEQLPGTGPAISAVNMPLMQSMSPAPAGDMSRPVDQRWNSEFSEGRRSDPRSPPRQLPSIPLPSAVDTQKYSNVQPQRILPDMEKVYTVDLPRGARGFGFSIRGGREFGNMPLFVLNIAEGGPADVDGRLKVGDQIIEINGLITENVTHAQAINLIQNGGPVIRLVAKRAGVALPPTTAGLGSPSQHPL